MHIATRLTTATAKMTALIVNAVVSTFPGVGTISVPIPRTCDIGDLYDELFCHLPLTVASSPLILTTASGRPLSPDSHLSLTELSQNGDFLSLRLVPAVRGGKGGFGSQLRAAGGRMSSKKKRKGEENNDSCRNLDGRRIRTVKEAKALAAYLEIKPEMERKEKEKRKERWRKIIEQGEAIDEFGANSNVRFDDVKWLEQTEEEREKTREAVLKAMNEMIAKKESSGSSEEDEEMEGEASSSGAITPPSENEKKALSIPQPATTVSKSVTTSAPRFADFDDDEFMSDSDEEASDDEVMTDAKGKGKAIAAAA